MIDEVFSKKFEPVVAIIDSHYENPAEKLSKLLAVTDAIFINFNILREHHELLLKTELFRCLALPHEAKDISICSVMADMKEGASLLTKNLLDNGHRKIATLFSDSCRKEGFEEAMNKYK